MKELSKVSSGLLYEENFGEDLSLIWDFIPNNLNRVKIHQNSVEILPGEERIEMIMPTPVDIGWVYQTHIDYNGRTGSEACGFILKSITDNVAECELRGDTRDLFSYLKMELDLESVFNLKASKDGKTWRDFGNSKMFDSNKFGYYMTEMTQYDSLTIKDCIIYKSNFITINNISKDLNAVVYDSLGANITHKFVMTHKDGVLTLDGGNMLFPIDELVIKFLDADFNIVREAILKKVYGGDIYDFAFNVTVRIEREILDNDTHHLDTVVGAYKLYAVSITSEEAYILNKRHLKIEPASAFNPGDLPVTIAETSSHDNTNNLDFKKELEVTFKPYENKNFFIKIARTQGLTLLEQEYKFKLTLI